jgi:cardiolipin synthase A/B
VTAGLRPTGPLGSLRLVATAIAAFTVLAGCTSMPILVPDMGRAPPGGVKLEGARGPLTAQQSKAALARLQARSADTAIFDRHLALEQELTGTPLVVGNRTTLLKDGPAAYRAMFAAIRDARSHIHLETYIIEDDEIGAQFAAALIDKRAQGVQVALIYDSVGALDTPKEFFDRLRTAGVQVLEFNPVNPLTARRGWEVNQRDHRKLLVVDGRTAFVGGINISGVYSRGSAHKGAKARATDRAPWRDTHVQLDGPVAGEFQKLFIATWEKQKGEPLARYAMPAAQVAGADVVRAIGSSPDEGFSLFYATLISAIDSAEGSVHLTNAYFVPDPGLLATLKAAAARGVDVTLVLPAATDSWLVFNAGRSYYAELLAAGVKIRERAGALLHAKTAVIDGVWSTVGSTNLDWRSFLHNDEVNAVILGPEFGAQMESMFQADLAASVEVTPASWARRPLADRMRELAAGAWEYWL